MFLLPCSAFAPPFFLKCRPGVRAIDPVPVSASNDFNSALAHMHTAGPASMTFCTSLGRAVYVTAFEECAMSYQQSSWKEYGEIPQ